MSEEVPREAAHRLAHQVLACPQCHRPPLNFAGEVLACGSCGWRGGWRGSVVSSLGAAHAARFDTLHEAIEAQNNHAGVWRWLYERQCRSIAAALRPGRVALDLGCGPIAPYAKPEGATIIGADLSLASLATNRNIDLGLHASAAALPLADETVDVVLAIYVFHHMVGETPSATRGNVEAAFREIARVAKPGADVLIFEICPWAATWAAERVVWTTARRLIGKFVDFFFWPRDRYEAFGREVFGTAHLEMQRFDLAWNAWFRPVLGLPWLEVPRIAFPFHVYQFHWRLPGAP
jgi:SAM-dependent methyltransferase